jgi:hypothetical protein
MEKKKEAHFDAVNGKHDRVLRDAGLEENVQSRTIQPLRTDELTRAPASMLTYKRHGNDQKNGIMQPANGRRGSDILPVQHSGIMPRNHPLQTF